MPPNKISAVYFDNHTEKKAIISLTLSTLYDSHTHWVRTKYTRPWR